MIKLSRIFAAATLLCSWSLTAMAGAEITWLETTHDFGAFSEENGAVACEFKYVNTGDEPLMITAARASCGCTRPKYSKTAIAPGDTSAVTVFYDPAGRPGRFNKKITIDTNTSPSRWSLHIKGVVIGSQSTLKGRYPVSLGALRLSHGYPFIGEVSKMHAKSVFLDGYNCSKDTIRPKILSRQAWIDVTAAPYSVPPGERVTFNFLVRPDNTPLYGFVTDTLTLIPDAANPQISIEMPVSANIVGNFDNLSQKDYAQAPVAQLSTKRIDMGEIPFAGESKTSFTIRNTGKSTLEIRRIYSLDPGVTVAKTPSKIKKGKSAEISVYVSPQAVCEKNAGCKAMDVTVSVITNDPLAPVQNIRIVSLPQSGK